MVCDRHALHFECDFSFKKFLHEIVAMDSTREYTTNEYTMDVNGSVKWHSQRLICFHIFNFTFSKFKAIDNDCFDVDENWKKLLSSSIKWYFAWFF